MPLLPVPVQLTPPRLLPALDYAAAIKNAATVNFFVTTSVPADVNANISINIVDTTEIIAAAEHLTAADIAPAAIIIDKLNIILPINTIETTKSSSAKNAAAKEMLPLPTFFKCHIRCRCHYGGDVESEHTTCEIN
jgi:hypothetical protein